ncbi:MAG: hypothetical protein ABIQ70_12055 [Dokdonella sp.]
MKNQIRLMLALAAGIFAFPALAQERTPLSAEATAAHAAAASLLPSHTRAAKPGDGPHSKVMGTHAFPDTPGANAFRAYPPSCAADPLPDRSSGPVYSNRTPLFARDTTGAGFVEGVTITVWRIPCSSSGAATTYNPNGLTNAITFVRIDRDAANEGNRSHVPTFPLVQASQGSIGFGTAGAPNPASLVRLASEPNTVIADTAFDSPIFDSTTYVLENYPYTGSGYFKFSDAFTLRIDPQVSGVPPLELNIPDYNAAQYPDATALMPFDGYAAAQWVNGTLNQGLLVQVTEQPQADGSTVRQIVFDLLTKDTHGDPLWLIGNASFVPFATSVTIQTNYLGNGLSQNPWGTAKFELEDCNHLDVTFSPLALLPSPIPVFSGLKTYDRLFSANGMLCE